MCLKPNNNQFGRINIEVKPQSMLRYKKSAAIKQLEGMILEDDRRKHPLIPPNYVAPTSFRDDSDKGLVRCILAFLKSHGHHAEQISNVGKRVDNRTTFEDVVGRRRTIGSINRVPGTDKSNPSDISVTIFNRSVRIKVEIGLNIQSRAGQDYQRAMEAIGIVYMVATSFDQFKSWYDSNFKEDAP